jgi:hypothetical protein
MPRSPARPFYCTVVSEPVTIALRRRNSLHAPGKLYVHCSERDCQHVDTNAPPCPLTLEPFADEIRERAAARQG